jgi:MFS family permease
MGYLATQAAYAVRALHAPAIGYGALMMSAAVGGTVASLTVGRIARRGSSLRVVPLACLVVTAGMVLIAVANGLLVAIIGSVCTGIGFALYNVTVVTARQELTPDKWRGRADSLSRSVAWGVLPAGSLLGGLISNVAGLRAPALAAACASAIGGIWVAMVTLRVANIAE